MGVFLRQKPTQNHPGGRAQHIHRQGQRRGGPRQAIHGVQNRADKVLDGAKGGGGKQKKQKAQPHRTRAQKIQRGRPRLRGAAGAMARVGNRRVPPGQRQQTRQGHQYRAQSRLSPAIGAGQRGQQQGRAGPAQIGRETMRRKRMPQARWRHMAVEHGEIRRVKHTIAQPGQRRHGHQHRQASGKVQGQPSQHKAADAAGQHPRRAKAIHQKTGHGLANARHHKKHRHGHADGGKA